ncbi:hypothetical protein [Luteimonas arsenica]|uniref:hypothetical protein n=1 Tax=Luteimonas arsenica TaxID=1586242 RepID=UPI0010564A10|nr:hypothetical protein [Luteimonas arsenica]
MVAKKESWAVPELQIDGLGLVKPGKKVKHPVFGRGTVTEIAEWASGEHTIRIDFGKIGQKWLVPEMAKLRSAWW